MKFFEKTLRKGETLDLPVVPLRDLVVFPGMVVPVFGGRRPTIEAIEEAMTGNRKVFLLSQKTVTQDPRE